MCSTPSSGKVCVVRQQRCSEYEVPAVSGTSIKLQMCVTDLAHPRRGNPDGHLRVDGQSLATQRGRRAVARTPCIGCGTSTGEPRFPDHQFHPDGGLPAKSQGELHGCGRSRSVRGDRRFSAPGHRGVQMFVAEQRPRGQRQMERRAKPARRSSHLIYPKAAALELQQSRSAHKNQNPQNWHLMARFDWGLGAVCFGASPVAAVFGSAPGSATSPEHRIYCKPAFQEALSK